VVNLLGAGDYADTQEIISGAVARKEGVKVLDGTESWVKTNSGDKFMFYIDETFSDAANVSLSADIILCNIATHIRNSWDSARDRLVQRSNKNFGFMNPTGFTKDNVVTDWTAYLAARYAAGTPVIVVYPLATETTESVAGQVLAKAPLTVTAEVSDPTITTTEAPVSIPDPAHPLPIWCNNGKLTKSANLVNVNGQTPVNLAYSGNILVTNADRYGYYIKVKPNTKYTISINREKTNAYLNICDTTSVPANNVSVQAYNAMDGTIAATTITTKANTNYLYVYTAYMSSGFDPFKQGDFQIEERATASTYHPFVYAAGTPEVLTVSGINLLDPSTSNIKIGQMVTENGGTTAMYPNNWRSDYIPVVGGKTYAFWGRAKADDTISAYNRINWFTADKTNILPRPSYTADTVTVGTAPSNAAFAMLSCSTYKSNAAITREDFDLYNWMFAEASAEIPYQPYVTPQTASVPTLLGVGDYKDAAELIHGGVTRKVGVFVSDGTANWAAASSTPNGFTISVPGKLQSRIAVIASTHYEYSYSTLPNIPDGCVMSFGTSAIGIKDSRFSTVEALNAEHAAHPVIFIYPLATPTTEQVQGQALYANTVDSEANVSPVDAEIKYYK
jgi:hypothetical protein